MKSRSILLLALAYIAPAIALAGPGNYNVQAKLFGTGAIGNANQGAAVAISADGNTALIGAPNDNDNGGAFGAAFFFTRSNGVWTQQGPKLAGLVFSGAFGASVALSGDGNTAAVGAPCGGPGQVVIFTRAGNVWSQQTALTGTPFGSPQTTGRCPGQGTAVALSYDGNTLVESAFVDGFVPPDNPTDCDGNPPGAPCGSFVGSIWIFARSSGVWTQQAKLPLNPNAENVDGANVTISADGNTVAADTLGIYVRSGNVWTAQGFGFDDLKLTGDGNTLVGLGQILYRRNGVWDTAGPQAPTLNGIDLISISADGSTLVGVFNANSISDFALTGGVWTVHNSYPAPVSPENRMLPTGPQIALSANGNTMIVGASSNELFNNPIPGGAWIYASPQLSTSLTHAGNFSHGQTNAKYTITVKNIGDREIHAAPTSAVNVIDKLPPGLIATAISGPGWNCTLSSVSCTRQDGLGIGASFPPVTVTVTVASSAASKVTNVATASGGGSNWGNANDVTFIVP